MTETTLNKSMDELVALCKRRGFIFPASEIYGGINGFWDYGPLGTELKNNLRDAWWNDMVKSPPAGPDGEPISILGVDSSIIQHPRVWEASGHVAGFNDPMVDDMETKKRFRADHLFGLWICDTEQEALATRKSIRDVNFTPPMRTAVASTSGEAWISFVSMKFDKKRRQAEWNEAKKLIVFDRGSSYGFVVQITEQQLSQYLSEIPSPFSQEKGDLTPPRMFNLMFETYIGAIRDDDAKSYLRPETAQGIFLNYKNVLDTMRVKMPFGIAQIGKAFRNEVTPRNFIFRSREFEQMEIEWFCHPDEAKQWYDYWCEVRKNWWFSVGLTGDNIQMREHENDELAHYAKQGCGCFDVEYRFPFTAPGYGELEGVADRTDYDLKQHQEHSGAKLEYFDQEAQVKGKEEGLDKDEINKRSRYLPHVIEPSAGLSRGVLAVLCEAFTPTPERKGSKFVMNFHPRMAPIKAAVFPLVNKDGMPEAGRKLYDKLRTKYAVQFDVKQSIGKRYARMDEAGTPYCFTIDSDTLSDQTVTWRERDTAEQGRINIEQVGQFLADKIGV